MDYINDFIDWLSKFSWFLGDENLQGLLRYATAGVTLLFSSISFIIKSKEKRTQTPAHFAVTDTSWDSQSKFPILPFPTKLKSAPFPFVSPDLGTRTKGSKGWFTITELRIWNAGQEPLWGSHLNPKVKLQVTIEDELGTYAFRGCLTNDLSTRVYLGRAIHSSSGQHRHPILFDVLQPGKGILLQIWHNSQDGSLIGVDAISERASSPLMGVHHPINPKVYHWMNRMTYIIILPATALTVFFIFSHSTAPAVMSGLFTWTLILSAYMSWKLKPLAPEDLRFRNEQAKVVFFHGPG